MDEDKSPKQISPQQIARRKLELLAEFDVTIMDVTDILAAIDLDLFSENLQHARNIQNEPKMSFILMIVVDCLVHFVAEDTRRLQETLLSPGNRAEHYRNGFTIEIPSNTRHPLC